MNLSSRRRRLSSIAQQSLLVLVLALLLDMRDSIRFLQQRIHFATALTTAHRVPRRNIGGVATSDKYLSTTRQYPSKVSSSVIAAVNRRSTGKIHTRDSFTRLFGSKRGVPGNPLGTVAIYNDQDAIPDIDEQALQQTVERISKLLGYETYDVTLLLVDDEEMRETNLESRGIDAPTDILSFPFHEPQTAGLLEEPEFDVPDYYTLGDMVVCVPYVIRRCQEDLEFFTDKHDDDDDDDDNDDVSNLEDDRGVSGAMATVQDPETRIRMLLVHGMLHLVGYDHIEDEEYIEMVEKEEELLKELGYGEL